MNFGARKIKIHIMKPGKDYIGVGGGVLIFNKKGEVLLMKRGMESKKCDEMRWFNIKNLPKKLTRTTKEPVKNFLKGRFIKLY